MGAGTVNRREAAFFNDMAAAWWDPEGPAAPLHRLNPLRLSYIRARTAAAFGRDDARVRLFDGLSVLDIGCGAGLVAEPLARMGARVTGIDAAEAALAVARARAAEAGLAIDYCDTPVEALAAEPPPGNSAEPPPGNSAEPAAVDPMAPARFDLVLALEVVEHADRPDLFLDAAARLVRPGGLLILSTLNRTAAGFLLGIVAAEHVLRLVPRGTHDWRRFWRPAEIAARLRAAGLRLEAVDGIGYDPLRRQFRLARGAVAVNYILTARRPDNHRPDGAPA